MFCDFCETYLNRQYFYVSLGKKIAYVSYDCNINGQRIEFHDWKLLY